MLPKLTHTFGGVLPQSITNFQLIKLQQKYNCNNCAIISSTLSVTYFYLSQFAKVNDFNIDCGLIIGFFSWKSRCNNLLLISTSKEVTFQLKLNQISDFLKTNNHKKKPDLMFCEGKICYIFETGLSLR